MAVTIVIPTPLRQFAGGNSEIEVNAATAGDALLELTATHAELRKHLYNEQDNLRNFINVYVGDEDIRHLDESLEAAMYPAIKRKPLKSRALPLPDIHIKKE